ncbi:folate-binding protein [uncultured Microbacterium sp.]|uniref:CAF17-like 4Fe-4S cluster assembly/insertion protein YgfZ n=1 Tax=uncultured Microbacterium sp. TaxID=191216 RepID=UPI0025D02F9B|nr:folate-binding protein [uncultured Microbacterium sp.]
MSESPLSETSSRPAFAERSGAVAADEGGAAHYGDPLGEQRALASGRAIVDLAGRRVIEVAGEDRLTWLHAITSQALTGLGAGESTELLVLDPQGRVEHEAAVVDDGASAWLITESGDAPGLVRWLTMMRFRSRVEVRERPELHVVGVIAGGAAEAAAVPLAVAPAGVAVVWRDPWVGVTRGGYQYATVESHPGAERAWVEVVLDDAGLDTLAGGGVDAAGSLAADALRVAAWRPRWGFETDERTIPHELDWIRSAVHLDKGCYRGQETVAKVHNLGHPPRRLVLLQLDGDLPAIGADVLDEAGAVVGRITSPARHFEQGPIALAVVRRGVPVDAVLSVVADDGPIAAAQEVIVPPEAGAAASVPRLPRLSSRR